MLEKYIYNADLENTTSTKEQLAKEAIKTLCKFFRYRAWIYFTPDGVKIYDTPLHEGCIV